MGPGENPRGKFRGVTPQGRGRRGGRGFWGKTAVQNPGVLGKTPRGEKKGGPRGGPLNFPQKKKGGGKGEKNPRARGGGGGV